MLQAYSDPASSVKYVCYAFASLGRFVAENKASRNEYMRRRRADPDKREHDLTVGRAKTAERNARARLVLKQRASDDPVLAAKIAEDNRNHQRAYRLKVTTDVVRQLLASNDGTCDTCHKTIKPRRDGSDGRCIDHCHATGRIRGVLCYRCNALAGAIDALAADPALAASLATHCARD